MTSDEIKEGEKGKRKFNNDVVKQLADYYNIKVTDIVIMVLEK